MRHLLSVDDLGREDVERIMFDSQQLMMPSNSTTGGTRPEFCAALLFLEPSLRTRLGFAVAVQRLGGNAVDIFAAKFHSDMSAPESFADTLRVVSDMVDVVIVRTAEPLSRAEVSPLCSTPIISGGDGGGNHPAQALIDLFAVRRAFPAHRPLRVGICGDLNMRSARSFARVLANCRLEHVSAFAPVARLATDIAVDGMPIETQTDGLDCRNLDVLYMAGLPERSGKGTLDHGQRQRFALTPVEMARLPAEAIVLSPMPVIDEISPECWSDRRIKVFEQSRDGVAVRMAILRYVLCH
jgi:aspartate carbamoyltransferase catalytic subunit